MPSLSLQSVNNWLSETALISEENREARDLLEKKLRKAHNAQTLPDRVLLLEKLVLACNRMANKLDSTINDNATFIVNINLLQAQTLFLLKSILDVKSNKELIIKLSENRGSFYSSGNQVIVQNFDHLLGENELLFYKKKDSPSMIYLHQKSEREQYRVILSEGKFKRLVAKNPQGSTADDISLHLEPFNTRTLKSQAEMKTTREYRLAAPEIAITETDAATIVVDKQGNMFAHKTLSGKFHHTSFVAGEEVFFAGLVKTNAEGELKEVANHSGHYKPKESHTINFLKQLSKRGALSTCIELNIISDRSCSSEAIEHNINLDTVQRDARREINPQTITTSYQTWKKNSDAGFFARRYSILKKIDNDLLQYFKFYNIKSPQENIDLLNRILASIEIQRKTHPHSKRANAINNLAIEIRSELSYYQEKQCAFENTEVNFSQLKIA